MPATGLQWKFSDLLPHTPLLSTSFTTPSPRTAEPITISTTVASNSTTIDPVAAAADFFNHLLDQIPCESTFLKPHENHACPQSAEPPHCLIELLEMRSAVNSPTVANCWCAVSNSRGEKTTCCYLTGGLGGTPGPTRVHLGPPGLIWAHLGLPGFTGAQTQTHLVVQSNQIKTFK